MTGRASAAEPPEAAEQHEGDEEQGRGVQVPSRGPLATVKRWEVLLGIRLLGTSGLLNDQAATWALDKQSSHRG